MEHKLDSPVKWSAKKREISAAAFENLECVKITKIHRLFGMHTLIRFDNIQCERMSSLNRIVNTLALNRVAIDTICDTRIDL